MVRKPRFHFPVLLWLVLLLLFARAGCAAAGEEGAVEKAAGMLAKGGYEECIEFCEGEMAEAAEPGRLEAVRLRALLERGDYEAAMDGADGFFLISRYDPELLLAVALVMEATRDDADSWARSMMTRRAVMGPPWNDGAAAVAAYAELALLSGQDGKKVLEEILLPLKKADPKARAPYLSIGRLALRHHDMEFAAENFQEGLKLYPEDGELLLGLALAGAGLPVERMDEDGGVRGYLDLALKVNPRFPEALLEKAKELGGKKDFDGAGGMLKRLFAVNPRHPEGRALEAAFCLLEEDEAGAKIALQKATEVWEGNPRVWFTIGGTLAGQYRFEEGIVHLKKAADLDPVSPEILFELGSNQLRFGDPENGWMNVQRAAQLDPYHVSAYNLMALRDKISLYPVLAKGDVMVRMSPGDEVVFGKRAMDLAVRAKETLAKKYGIDLEQPVMVEMLPEQEDFAIRTFGLPGGEGFLGVCFGPLITMTSPRGRLGRANWEAVLWHEMAHTITLELSGHRIPRWLTEGISVYEERVAREGWGARMNAGFRAYFTGNDIFPIEKLNEMFGTDVMLAYYQSSLVVEYIVEEFGQETLVNLIKDLGLGDKWEDVLAGRTRPLSELNEDFRNHAKKLAEGYGKDVDWTGLSDDEYLAFRGDPEAWLSKHPDRYATNTVWMAEKLRDGKWAEAKAMAEKLIEALPDNREEYNPYEALAAACRGLNDSDGERQALETLYRLDADRSEAAARLLAMEGSGIADAERMLETNPFQDVALRVLARERPSPQSYAALLALEPRDGTRLHYELAELLRTTDRAAALRHVLRALEDNPRFKPALELLVSLEDER